MSFVIDCSVARPAPSDIKAAGASGVMRYTGDFRYDGAVISPGEYQAYRAAGLDVGLVMEYDEYWLLRGYAAGHQLALAARALEDKRGIPHGVTYAAADADFTLGGPPASAQALSNCQRALDTMHGMADAYGGWQYVAPYGSRWFCEWISAHSPITRSWSTQAWSWDYSVGRFVPAANAMLFQYAGWPAGVPVVGGCDYNELRGAWAPRNAAVVPPITPPVNGGDIVSGFITMDLNKPWNFATAQMRVLRGLLCAWNIEIEGVLITPNDTNSHRTREAVKFFQSIPGFKITDKPGVVGESTWRALTAALRPIAGR